MKWSSRNRAVYTTLLTQTIERGRPPSRQELCDALPVFGTTSEVGRILRRMVEAGLVEEVTPGDFVMVRTREGARVTYLVEVAE
jgi:copper homeostasis protein CutC